MWCPFIITAEQNRFGRVLRTWDGMRLTWGSLRFEISPVLVFTWVRANLWKTNGCWKEEKNLKTKMLSTKTGIDFYGLWLGVLGFGGGFLTEGDQLPSYVMHHLWQLHQERSELELIGSSRLSFDRGLFVEFKMLKTQGTLKPKQIAVKIELT